MQAAGRPTRHGIVVPQQRSLVVPTVVHNEPKSNSGFRSSRGLPGLPVFAPPPQPHLYVRTEPVYVQPCPVYDAPPAIVYERQWRPSYRREYERERAWRYGHDQDHDGVPNRYDRDSDGDGVPNRYDRRPDNPYRR
jgi:hypothetical protein